MVRYTNSEKMDMYDVYIRFYRNVDIAVEEYAILYPERNAPTRKTLYSISRNLLEFGCLSKTRRKYHVINTQHENVLAQVSINPELSSKYIGNECGISASWVQKILKKHNYKFKIVNKLHPGDSERRLEFCNWCQTMLEQLLLQDTILWTDETSFTNSGVFNRRNEHFYAIDNPHLTQQTRPQIRYSSNVWCGIIKNQIIGPTIIEGNLNGVAYVNLLTDVMEEIPLATLRKIKWFMQDGCAAHNSAVARDFLNTSFPDRWIGTHGPVRWPARSPCLNPMDYFLWGFLKNKVYHNEVNSVEELRRRITSALRDITPEIVLNAVGQLRLRTQKCIENNGGHFEQHLS